ncbi:DUF1638 domain-containing protein [Candidatus Poribacteria bacterium]|nr:DUF1638 domain-containing protein [Candidatus Poribacteria bacterium]
MLLKMIACEIAFREMCMAAARSVNLIDFEFFTQGYHDNPDIGRALIQEKIDSVENGKYDAILLGYALCNNMLVGLTTHHIPLVIPRAHDCITFFLGSKERYMECYTSRPGTYYYTSGWLEYRKRKSERVPAVGYGANPALRSDTSGAVENPQSRNPEVSQGTQSGYGRMKSYQELVEQYGEDNAKYVMEVLGNWTQNYTHGVLIDFDFTRHLNFRQQVEEICRQHGWEYDELKGDMNLLQRLLDGDWNSKDFLVVHSGEIVRATYDERVIDIEKV